MKKEVFEQAKRFVDFKDVNVGYDGKTLIHDINLDIRKGEIITLIGPNGAGKSTILKSLTRQLKMISGKIVLDDKDIMNYSYRDLSSRMAVMLTERIKPELMTCYDIVATGRFPYTGRLGLLTAEDEEKVDAAMAAVHASELGSRDYNAISDGQKQRVLLARAICQEPDLMILDEPTSFLDIRHKLELLSILRHMAKDKGITVIMSLHEIDLAQKVSDRIVCVKGDHIFQFGTPEEIFESNRIQELYEIDNGHFDALFGSIEMPGPEGDAKTLVLGNNEHGIPVYRHLQMEDEAFIAALLYKNESDYRVAKMLAKKVIAAEPFSRISRELIDETLQAIEHCQRIIDAGVTIGPGNQEMEEIMKAARASGKLECWNAS